MRYTSGNFEKLLLHTFRHASKKNKVVSTYEDNKSSKVKNDVIVKEDINILNKKNSKERKVSYKIKLDKKSLPIEKDSKIGTLEVIENNKVKSKIYNTTFVALLFLLNNWNPI